MRALLLLLLPTWLAGAGLVTQSGARHYAQAGGGSEFVGSYTNLDLETHPIYRIDMSAQDYPTFLTAGATHTYEAAGCWDGGPAAKLTPPVSGGTDGYSALGGFVDLWKGDTFAIHTLNIRWEASFGSTYVTHWAEGADLKWVIVHSRESLGGEATNQRPMVNWQKPSGNNVFQLAVGAGTFKQFNPAAPPNDFGPEITRSDFFLGPTAGTLSDEPIIGADTWLSFELQMIGESTVEAPNGRIRIVVTDRTGAVLTDIVIEWMYDASWGPLPRYFDEVQVIGGFYNELYGTSDANTYQRICAPTFAAGHDGLIGPRSGFVQ